MAFLLSYSFKSFWFPLLLLLLLYIYIYIYIYGSMFCMLLFNFVTYVFLMLCSCVLTVMYVLFCVFSLHRANWHSSATLTEDFPCFFSVVRQMSGYNLQRRGTVRTLSNWAIIFTPFVYR
jgi:hypothetical protein